MTKLVYDTDNSGVVDNSELLAGQAGSYYLDRANHTGSLAITDITNLQTVLNTKLEASDISNKADVATTLAGYGITDGMTAVQIADAIEAAKTAVKNDVTG